MSDLAERLAEVSFPLPFRRQQEVALAGVDAAWSAGRTRAWVVLPPGAGKTVLGLEAARRLGSPVVVLAPNAAVQAQWVRAWRRFGPPVVRVGTERDLSADLTVLPCSALAPFSPDDEVDADGDRAPTRPALSLADRLHVNGRNLLRTLEESGPFTLVLDEAAHLLDAWGALLGELVERLPSAHVLALTATPPTALDPAQADLVDRVFGPAVVAGSVPAGIRDGDLAPYAELVRLVAPTPGEQAWLAESSARLAALVDELLDGDGAPVTLLAWAAARAASWDGIVETDPGLADVLLRLSSARLLALPAGARPAEEHRRPLSADDWVRLVDDWVRGCLLPADDPASLAAYDRLRAALPSVGWTLTRRGLRRGRGCGARVLARSAAKTRAVLEVLAAEHSALGGAPGPGPGLRAVVLVDHERAPASLPRELEDVLHPQSGTARHLLTELLAEPCTAGLSPVLVTGRAVAAHAETARDLVAFVAARSPQVRLDPVPAVDGRRPGPGADVVEVTGDWASAAWAGHLTAYLEAGRTRLLLGTRSLLGEGWDCRSVNVVVDLTSAPTPPAAGQGRGRALRTDRARTDPTGTDTVAHVWSVVCIDDDSPDGAADWYRFVRRSSGVLAVDLDGEVVEGVAAVHPRLSPHAPPAAADRETVDADCLARVGRRAETRAAWRVGEPYADEVAPTVRVSGAAAPDRDPVGARGPAGEAPSPPRVLPAARGVWRDPALPDPRRGHALSWIALAAGAAVPAVLGVPEASVPAAVAVAAPVQWTRSTLEAGRLVRQAGGPDVTAMACALADGLRDAGVIPVGSEAVASRTDSAGVRRIALAGAGREAAAVFAAALAELLGPLGAPRYLIPRRVPPAVGTSRREQRRAGRAWLARRGLENAVVHHPVPAVLGGTVRRATAFAGAWSRWVSAGAEPVYTGSAEGAALLADCRGTQPLPGTVVLRSSWS